MNFKVIMAFGLVSSSAVTMAAPQASSVKGLTRVWDAGGRGNAYFNTQLRREMRADGWKFVKKRGDAQAILNSSGDWTKNGFSGTLTLRAPSGKILWKGASERKNGARTMAFQSLGQKLRAARR